MKYRINKKVLIPTLIVLAIALGAGAVFINPLLPIITGYAAKGLASGVFVSNRTQYNLEKEDLNFFPINLAESVVDTAAQSVTSSFLWHKSTAVYIEGFGCTLVRGYSAEEIKNRDYPKFGPSKYDSSFRLWPMGDQLLDTIPQGINKRVLDLQAEALFDDADPRLAGTHGLIVLYKGQPVYERYRADFDRRTRFLSWSMAKSFTSALIGLRVAEGKMDIHQPASISNIDKKVSVNNLLQMNSGLQWNEDYGNESDVTLMLYKQADMGLYCWNRPEENQPGAQWYYSSGSTNAASLALRQSFDSDNAYWRYPKEQLFDKLGMQTAVFELDPSGSFIGSSYIYATLRDYARFGQLYLNQGQWMGEQILPKQWVRYTQMVANGSGGKYGSSFWLNADGGMPNTPTDAMMCRGHDGQIIAIIPSKELVIVRLGYTPDGMFDYDLLISKIIKAVQ